MVHIELRIAVIGSDSSSSSLHMSFLRHCKALSVGGFPFWLSKYLRSQISLETRLDICTWGVTLASSNDESRGLLSLFEHGYDYVGEYWPLVGMIPRLIFTATGFGRDGHTKYVSVRA